MYTTHSGGERKLKDKIMESELLHPLYWALDEKTEPHGVQTTNVFTKTMFSSHSDLSWLTVRLTSLTKFVVWS